MAEFVGVGVCVETSTSVDVLEGRGVGDGDAVFDTRGVHEGLGVGVEVSVGAGDVGDSSCLKGAAYKGCTLTNEIMKMMSDAPAVSSEILFQRFESRCILIKALPYNCYIIAERFEYIIHGLEFTSRMNYRDPAEYSAFRLINEYKSAS